MVLPISGKAREFPPKRGKAPTEFLAHFVRPSKLALQSLLPQEVQQKESAERQNRRLFHLTTRKGCDKPMTHSLEGC